MNPYAMQQYQAALAQQQAAYVGACGGGGCGTLPLALAVLPGQFPGQSGESYWQNVVQGLTPPPGFGPGIPAGTPGDPCPGSRPATAAEIAAGLVDAGGRCYAPGPYISPGTPSIPFVPPPVPYYPGGGPCGPAAFDAMTFQRSAMAGAIGALAPVTLIGLGDDCPPLLPAVPTHINEAGDTIAATEGDICEACCSPQGCFCVTKITIPNCGPCIFLLTSIKSGRCEILECGSVMADSFYCDCDPPPIKTSMLQPGLEFCITAQNVCVVPVIDDDDAALEAAIAACTFRFRATLYGISTDEPCRPCLY